MILRQNLHLDISLELKRMKIHVSDTWKLMKKPDICLLRFVHIRDGGLFTLNHPFSH